MNNSFYINSLRLRATFFYLITVFFLLAVSIGICIQSTFYLLAHQNKLSSSEILLCLVLNPLIFLLAVILCNNIFALLFDSMDNPPFLKFRAKAVVALRKSEDLTFKNIKFINIALVTSFELFPVLGILFNVLLSHKFDLSHIVTGYVLGGFFFSIIFSLVYIFCHGFIFKRQTRQNLYFDYLSALEKSETFQGFGVSSKQIISNLEEKNINKNVKKPSRIFAISFLFFSLITIFISLFLTLPEYKNIFLSVFMSCLTLVFLGVALKFYFPKVLGLSFYFLTFIYLIISISMTYLGVNNHSMQISKPPIPLTYTDRTHEKLITESKVYSEYPICKMRWKNKLLNKKQKYLTALDFIAISTSPYVYLDDEQKEFNYANKYIQQVFNNTNVGPVVLEHFDNWETFGRSIIIYFPELKIRLMVIRGTHIHSELLYDLQVFSFIELLNFFDVITPVIGLLPDEFVQLMVKWVDFQTFLGSDDLVDSLYEFAKKNNNKSIKNNDEFIVVGHSLGGAIAGIFAGNLQVQGVAISTPGTKHLLKRFNINEDQAINKALTTLIFDNDIVTKVSEHLGSVNYFRCDFKNLTLCHNPNALLCKIYENCGDIHSRSLTFGCSEKDFSNFYDLKYKKEN